MYRSPIPAVALLALAAVFPAQASSTASHSFHLAAAAEVTADLTLSSTGTDWSSEHTAAVAELVLDGEVQQVVVLYAGAERHTYRVFLGRLEPGSHRLELRRQDRLSAPGAPLEVHEIRTHEMRPGDAGYAILANAPIVYARADMIEKFTDIPLLVYCSEVWVAGKQVLEYTVVFSNEDGGTSTRALMARWGRTTDIEWTYRTENSPGPSPVAAFYQGKDHADLPFPGPWEGRHPLLKVVTLNNMLAPGSAQTYRFQPVPVPFTPAAREVIMDRNPWLYAVASKELIRERKLRPFSTVAGESIGDPRNYLNVDLRLEVHAAALAVKVRLKDSPDWHRSHLGRKDLALARNSWMRTTIELPPFTRPDDIAEIAFDCLVPEPRNPQPVEPGACALLEVSQAFLLDRDYRPQPSLWRLQPPGGWLTIPAGETRVFSR